MGPEWSHTAWQPMIEAFISAYKSGGGLQEMIPQEYEGTYAYAQGAMWYKTILQNANCVNDDGGVDSTGPEQYWQKPDGYNSGKDSVNWAIIMPHGTEDYTVSVSSGGVSILSGRTLTVGLNFGNIPEVYAGVQTMQVLDPNGNIFMTATGGRCISDSCPDFIYNMNYQVIPLELGTATGTCSSSNTDIYAPPSIWTDSNPSVQCIPPCAIILPPLDLGYTTTINFNPLVTSIWSLDGSNTVTKTTTINIPPLTTTAINFWRISALASETHSTVISPLQSIMPPSIVLSLPATEATFVPVPSGSPAASPTFYQSQHPVTLQPQATQSISIASPSIPSVTFASATPTAICTTGCGTDSCAQFGGCSSSDASNDCGTDGCGGGCNVQSCSNNCGIACSSNVRDPDGDEDYSNYPDTTDSDSVKDSREGISNDMDSAFGDLDSWTLDSGNQDKANQAQETISNAWKTVEANYNLMDYDAQQYAQVFYDLINDALNSAFDSFGTTGGQGPDISQITKHVAEAAGRFFNKLKEYLLTLIVEGYGEAFSQALAEADESDCSLSERSLGKRARRRKCKFFM